MLRAEMHVNLLGKIDRDANQRRLVTTRQEMEVVSVEKRLLECFLSLRILQMVAPTQPVVRPVLIKARLRSYAVSAQ